MNRWFPTLMCSALFYCTHAGAINVGAITSIISPDQSVIAKEVINTVDDARLVSLRDPNGEQAGNNGHAIQPDIARQG